MVDITDINTLTTVETLDETATVLGMTCREDIHLDDERRCKILLNHLGVENTQNTHTFESVSLDFKKGMDTILLLSLKSLSSMITNNRIDDIHNPSQKLTNIPDDLVVPGELTVPEKYWFVTGIEDINTRIDTLDEIATRLIAIMRSSLDSNLTNLQPVNLDFLLPWSDKQLFVSIGNKLLTIDKGDSTEHLSLKLETIDTQEVIPLLSRDMIIQVLQRLDKLQGKFNRELVLDEIEVDAKVKLDSINSSTLEATVVKSFVNNVLITGEVMQAITSQIKGIYRVMCLMTDVLANVDVTHG